MNEVVFRKACIDRGTFNVYGLAENPDSDTVVVAIQITKRNWSRLDRVVKQEIVLPLADYLIWHWEFNTYTWMQRDIFEEMYTPDIWTELEDQEI